MHILSGVLFCTYTHIMGCKDAPFPIVGLLHSRFVDVSMALKPSSFMGVYLGPSQASISENHPSCPTSRTSPGLEDFFQNHGPKP